MPKCPYCSKVFGRISSLQSHSAFCAIQHQGKYAAKNSMDELDIPPIRDMYIVLQKLLLDNEKLRGKIEQLEKYANREKKKICLIDWLNEHKQPRMDFSDWVKNIVVTRNDFDKILDSNIINLIMDIVDNNISETMPVCSFDQKLKTIFIYTKEEWRIVEKTEFYRFIDSIIRKLTSQLNEWIQRNEIHSNKEEQFYMYTKKIYAIDTEKVSDRVHLRLYNRIKYNLRNIVEYEFNF